MNISIIIPAYNSEKTIDTCLNSVINQTYKGEIEIIVINDGSEDNTQKIVEEIINKNKKLSIKIINQKNAGVSKARNIGLKLANGNYIALLDSDDEWLIDKLEKQLSVFNSDPEVSFVGGLINENKIQKQELIIIPLKKLIFKNYFQPSTVIFKKNILETVGFFDENQNYAEEGNYFIRIAKHYKCVLLNEQLILYGQGKEGFGVSGLSANLKEMEKGELKNLSFAYKQNYISLFTYLIAISFSILKYIRRIIIVKIR